jgi:fucose 4-O-acetylase-like acetyltransferase
VDILNCMGLALVVLSAVAVFDANGRARYTLVAGLAIAGLAPVMANLNWTPAPALLQEYLVPVAAHNRFPFFPCASYAAFGLAVGTIVKHTPEERFERVMQWGVLIGFGLILVAQYLSNIPYSIYAKSDFWLNSPTLILIRAGISLLIMAGAFVWTEYAAGAGWSWMQCLGKNSLQVYWVHVMLVYGIIAAPVKRTMTAWQAALATALVVVLMIWMSNSWLEWKQRRRARHPVGQALSPANV